MKCIVALVVLVLAAVDSSIIPKNNWNSNLSVGTIGSGDRLLQVSSSVAVLPGTTWQTRDVTWWGTARVTAVRATENGVSQGGRAFIIGGGVGQNYVIVRLQSVAFRGFNYRVEIWGR